MIGSGRWPFKKEGQMQQYKKDPIVFLVINWFTLLIPFFLNVGGFFNAKKADAKINWVVDWLLSMCTCGIGLLFVVFPKYSKLLDEARAEVGLPPKNLGILHAFLSPWGVYEMTAGINEVIDAKKV